MSATYTFHDARLRSPMLRTVNAFGGVLEKIGLPVAKLSSLRVIAAASQKANLNATPDAATSEALERFVRSVNAESNLNTFGRLAVQNMLVGALQSQFCVLDWHRKYPALANEPIERPWIILGMPRTGTSILSILLGLDPLARPILQWEARYPIPPATLADAAEDPRIAQLSSEFAQLKKLNPAIGTMHPFGSTLAEECTAIMMYSLRTVGLETMAYAPSFGHWLENADMTPAYDIHRMTLQAFQAAQPTAHWVLKSPNHLWCLPTLVSAYPDARIIWTHRDPAAVLPSLASLNCAMQMQFTHSLDPRQVGGYWADKIDFGIDAAMRFDREAEPGWCHHVQYRDLVDNPVETLAGIYSRFDTPMSELHQKRVTTWLQQRPQHAAGIHAYDPADFGWTNTDLQNRFRHYRERYVTC